MAKQKKNRIGKKPSVVKDVAKSAAKGAAKNAAKSAAKSGAKSGAASLASKIIPRSFSEVVKSLAGTAVKGSSLAGYLTFLGVSMAAPWALRKMGILSDGGGDVDTEAQDNLDFQRESTKQLLDFFRNEESTVEFQGLSERVGERELAAASAIGVPPRGVDLSTKSIDPFNSRDIMYELQMAMSQMQQQGQPVTPLMALGINM